MGQIRHDQFLAYAHTLSTQDIGGNAIEKCARVHLLLYRFENFTSCSDYHSILYNFIGDRLW